MIIHTLIYRFADSVSEQERDTFFAELRGVALESGLVTSFGCGPHHWLSVDDQAKGMTGNAVAQFSCADLETLRMFSELPHVHEFITRWRARAEYTAAYANHEQLLVPPTQEGNPMHHTEHTVTVAAPVEVVWDVLVDVEGYARIFPPTQQVTILEESPDHQIARLVVDVHGETQSWVSRRDIDSTRHIISYRQLENAPIMGFMGGDWRALPVNANTTQLVLTHDFKPKDADPADGKVVGKFTYAEADELLQAAVERNSVADLDAVKDEAEQRVSNGVNVA